MLSQIAATALIALVNSQGQSYLNAQEGQELMSAGFITVDGSQPCPTDPSRFLVGVTEAGMQYAANIPTSQVPAVPPTPKPSFAIDTDIALPKIERGGNVGNLKPRESQYPFEALEIGQSFHVPATAEDPTPAKRMASNVSAANARYKEPTGNKVEKKHKKARKNADGTFVLENGKKVYDITTVVEDEMRPTRHFVCREVSAATDPRGTGCRIFRVEIPVNAVAAPVAPPAHDAVVNQPIPAPAVPAFPSVPGI